MYRPKRSTAMAASTCGGLRVQQACEVKRSEEVVINQMLAKALHPRRVAARPASLSSRG